MEKIKQILSDMSLFLWILGLVISIIGFLWYFWKWVKLQYRFGQNLKRKIYFLKTSENKDLQSEKEQIKNLNLLNIDEEVKNISNNLNILQNLKDNAVYIVGYDENFNDYEKLINEAKNNKIPVIIYAKQGKIPKESPNWEIFNSYIFCDVANTSNRLVIILLNILKIV